MINFVKMHGIGNDFVMLDGIAQRLSSLSFPSLAREVCHRRFGVGADGLILLEAAGDRQFRMRMWNPDGSESEMCGNGIRCFAKLAADRGYSDGKIQVQTGAGLLEPEVLPDGRIRVDMGPGRLHRGEVGMEGPAGETFIEQTVTIDDLCWKGTAVSMGNPHLVIFVDDVAAIPLETWGPRIENHPLFPNRVNVHFAQVVSPTQIVQRTWERGAGATLACGTGACSVAVAGRVTGRTDSNVTIELPGGELYIEAREGENVFMTGPAETVFVGTWPDPSED